MARKLINEIVDLGRSSGEGLFEADGSKVAMHKFVLLKTTDSAILVHGPISAFPYHANLIDAFCTRNEIPSHWINRPDKVEIDDPEFVVRGGGLLEYDPLKKQLRFGGRSTAYGRFDSSLLDQVLDADLNIKDIQVLFR